MESREKENRRPKRERKIEQKKTFKQNNEWKKRSLNKYVKLGTSRDVAW